MNDSKQVVIGFKVSALKKKKIEQTAADLGVDVSTYLRDRILPRHEKVARLTKVPNELVIEEGEIEMALKAVRYLKRRHPKVSTSKLLNAALNLAVENESRIISNKIQNHI